MDLLDPSERPAVHFLSLGCPKNRLDTEVMIGGLALGGFPVAERLEDAGVAVVNTCSFIESAREESIQAILDVCDRKQAGALQAVVVAGCLPQRYAGEIANELPEVDAFVGTGDFPRLPEILEEALQGRGGVYVEAGRTHLYDETDPRVLIGRTHTAYVKLSEGCDRVCAFCAIPGIRGRFQSRTGESLLAEARQLAGVGVREINLVAQDSTSWGKDLPGRPKLHTVLRELDGVEGLDWIRLLYLYPTAVSDELIETLASGRRLLPYVDVPLQHASDRLLRAMKRGTTAARQRELVARLRSNIPGLTLRTTFIVGFPGETDADFEELCEFVRTSRFERMGVFRYSDEEDTAAFAYGDKVPRELARERHRTLMGIQREIMTEQLEASVGSEQTVLVESDAAGQAHGRLASQAPEIDGVVFLKGAAEPGELVRVRITGVRGVDLDAEIVPAAGA
ncbi:MAG: 30S ribosomal protein S12 methylthiotransferase RimO [Myxococcales bacterium]|nr:30S ribosomal protein S12 methylthiotransferase RimO [Myxococcales bacterium]